MLSPNQDAITCLNDKNNDFYYVVILEQFYSWELIQL